MHYTGMSIITRMINQYEQTESNASRCAAVSLLMWEYPEHIAEFRKSLIKSGDYEQLATLDEMVDSYRPRRAVRVHMSHEELLRLLRERKK